ncbi:hypothetical protein KL86DYS2_12119 [uncultured Dysgonomonas sp.]|uniref:Uncharacterized protein n=1 Tax=uncultured Dysgonomonas sp. TaxID=206096 RepID=A0A212JR84_9BACT|nr:hypothetical protein KL86DYS2_12119 [uncultured Dysgonomonas sp.]
MKRVGSSDGISGEPTIYVVPVSPTVIKRKKLNKSPFYVFYQ